MGLYILEALLSKTECFSFVVYLEADVSSLRWKDSEGHGGPHFVAAWPFIQDILSIPILSSSIYP